MIKAGTWWLHSKSDPRWNARGESEAVGGFVMPEECEAEIQRLEKELGETPPKDLEFGYMKY